MILCQGDWPQNVDCKMSSTMLPHGGDMGCGIIDLKLEQCYFTKIILMAMTKTR